MSYDVTCCGFLAIMVSSFICAHTAAYMSKTSAGTVLYKLLSFQVWNWAADHLGWGEYSTLHGPDFQGVSRRESARIFLNLFQEEMCHYKSNVHSQYSVQQERWAHKWIALSERFF